MFPIFACKSVRFLINMSRENIYILLRGNSALGVARASCICARTSVCSCHRLLHPLAVHRLPRAHRFAHARAAVGLAELSRRPILAAAAVWAEDRDPSSFKTEPLKGAFAADDRLLLLLRASRPRAAAFVASLEKCRHRWV